MSSRPKAAYLLKKKLFPFVTLESFNIVDNCLTGGTESKSDNEGNRLDEKQFFNIAELG